MKSTLEPLDGNKVKLSVEVDPDEFDHDIDSAFRKIAKEVRIPGFRPGKAPRRVLEARIGVAPAREQALRDAIPIYLARAVREHDVDIIATPQVEITGGEDTGPVVFDATVEVRPQVTVPGYAGLRIELPSLDVSDDDIDAPIDSERRRHGDLVDVDRPAVTGDFVTLDMAATRDGEPVAGLNADDWLYEIGRGWIAPDFDEHLIGVKADAELSFTTTPTGTEEPADFTATVQKVQELQLPELTDEWVAENVDQHETVQEWRHHLRLQLTQMKLFQAQNLLIERTTEALAGLVDEEPPEPLVQSDTQRRATDLVNQIQQRGMAFEQYLAMRGLDQDGLVAEIRATAATGVKVDLALRAVAEAESLDVDDADLEAEFERIAADVRQKPNQVRKAYERNDAVPELRAELRKRKALDWLFNHIEIVDPEGQPIEHGLVVPKGSADAADGEPDGDENTGGDESAGGSEENEA
ncbi:MAG: trigger factor [Acidimicrobiaceae bacterium]|jgi:trigger factor|nr:trigger factor [Acidimicrobiaceae bacterium]